MDTPDPELQRLQRAEEQARGLYERLRRSSLCAEQIFVDNARDLWKEATDTVNRYKAQKSSGGS